MLKAAGGSGAGLRVAFNPFDQHGQRVPDGAVLLDHPRFDGGDAILQAGPQRGAGVVGISGGLDHVGQFHDSLLQFGDLAVALRQGFGPAGFRPAVRAGMDGRTDPIQRGGAGRGRIALARGGGGCGCDIGRSAKGLRRLAQPGSQPGRRQADCAQRVFICHHTRGQLQCAIGGHLADNLRQHHPVDPAALLHPAENQQAVDDHVDAARNATGGGIDLAEHALVESGVAVPPHQPQPVQNIGLDLAGFHRVQVMGGDNALAQLLQLGVALNIGAKLRLAQQQDLQQRVAAQLEVGEHAQLFQRLDGQVLRFIDHQQAAATSEFEKDR